MPNTTTVRCKFCNSFKIVKRGFRDLKSGKRQNNYERHYVLQRFLLSTDKATIAVEVPVFLTKKESKNILKIEGGLLGHIDFLQVFENCLIILDYKPCASKDNHAYIQLLLYAIALSKRTSIHLKSIKCAWFDEKDYFIFHSLNVACTERSIVESLGKLGTGLGDPIVNHGIECRRRARCGSSARRDSVAGLIR